MAKWTDLDKPPPNRDRVGIPDMGDKLHDVMVVRLETAKQMMRLYSRILMAIAGPTVAPIWDECLYLQACVLDGPDYFRDQVMPVIITPIWEAYNKVDAPVIFIAFEEFCDELIRLVSWEDFWNTGEWDKLVFQRCADKAVTTLMARKAIEGA